MDDIRRTLRILDEWSPEKIGRMMKDREEDTKKDSAKDAPASTSFVPKTNLPNSYYLAAAANLWVAVRFGMGNRLGRGGGDTSDPIFDWFKTKTADNQGLVIGVSENAKGLKQGTWHEHIVPCKLIVDRAIDIYQKDAPSGELLDDKEELKRIKEVAILIKKYLFVVRLTTEEASIIDDKLKLQTRMPDGWDDNVFARIGAVGKAYGKENAITVYDISDQSKIIYGPTGK